MPTSPRRHASAQPPAAAAPHENPLQAALARSEERYRLLVHRAGYGIYVSSPEGRFLDVNAALVSMLGYESSDELYALDIARDVYVDPDERTRLRQQPQNTRDYLAWVQTRWRRKDGTPIHVRLSVRTVSDDEGRIQSYEGIAEDVTERLRQEELLRRTERMASVGTTLAGVAHELNNPLAAIIGFAQLLLRKPMTEEDHAALETINHEATRSAIIVKDLLTLARKRETERRSPTNLNDIAGYIMRTKRYALETAGIHCELRLDSLLPAVLGDRTQLEQVLMNLVNNAEQALLSQLEPPSVRAGASPRITITTRTQRACVRLDVEDNGPGLPQGAHSQIWDPFWTTKREGEGTGLGLAVVHGIVADHGGTICVEAGADGRGARFIVQLPAAPARDTATIGTARRPLDVLLIDSTDNPLDFVERFLASRGHAVVRATSVDLAMRLAVASEFDAAVCVSDVAGVTGSGLLKQLRQTPGCSRARMVLASDNPTDMLRRSDELFTGSGTISQPYDIEELRRQIEGE